MQWMSSIWKVWKFKVVLLVWSLFVVDRCPASEMDRRNWTFRYLKLLCSEMWHWTFRQISTYVQMNVLQPAKYGSNTFLLKVDKFVPYQSNKQLPPWAPHLWLMPVVFQCVLCSTAHIYQEPNKFIKMLLDFGLLSIGVVGRCMYLIVLNQCRQERDSEVQGCILAPPWNFDII
jgi:hypothetical protein